MNISNKYITFLIIFLLFSIFVVLYNKYHYPRSCKKPVRESMTILDETDELVEDMTDGSKNFCRENQEDPVNMNTKCAILSNANCKMSECCALVNDDKCMAGDTNGPVFKNDSDGKSIPIDSYYYMNKCYGPSCLK